MPRFCVLEDQGNPGATTGAAVKIDSTALEVEATDHAAAAAQFADSVTEEPIGNRPSSKPPKQVAPSCKLFRTETTILWVIGPLA